MVVFLRKKISRVIWDIGIYRNVVENITDAVNLVLSKLFVDHVELPDEVVRKLFDLEMCAGLRERGGQNWFLRVGVTFQQIQIKLDLMKGVRGVLCEKIYQSAEHIVVGDAGALAVSSRRVRAMRTWYLAMVHDFATERAVTRILPSVLPVPVTPDVLASYHCFVSSLVNPHLTKQRHLDGIAPIKRCVCKWWVPVNHRLQPENVRRMVETVMLCAARIRAAGIVEMPAEMLFSVLSFVLL